MTQPVFYQTLTNVGIDPTQYYPNIATAGGSVTPEYPAPPFLPGTRAFGSDNSEFVFVQASTAINLTDFVAIYAANAVNPYQAASVTSVNVWNSGIVGIGSAGLVLKQSVTTIPAGAFFWACTRGTFVPATTSGGLAGPAGLTGSAATVGGGVDLYVALSAIGGGSGILTSVTSTLVPAIAGIICVNSITVGISTVPPVGTLSSLGFTVGPVVNLNLPRYITVFGSGGASTSSMLGGFGYAV